MNPNNLPTGDPFLDDIVVRKIDKNTFFIKGVEDELMRRDQLTRLLASLKIPLEEIGLMYLALYEKPDHNEVHFRALKGHFLYTSKYYLTKK